MAVFADSNDVKAGIFIGQSEKISSDTTKSKKCNVYRIINNIKKISIINYR